MGFPVVSWQILSKNPEAQSQFYQRAFGWSVRSDNPLGYRMVETNADGKGVSGGMWPAPPEAPAFVQLFIEVENLQSTIDTCKKLGGGVVIPPQKLPQGQSMAVIRDPEGLTFGLIEAAA